MCDVNALSDLHCLPCAIVELVKYLVVYLPSAGCWDRKLS